MNPAFERIRRQIESKEIASALLEIREIEQTAKGSPRLAVLKAMCLQLSEADGPLEDVHSALQQALLLNDEYVEAHLEMGWFLYAVQDQTKDAQEAFERALHLLRKQNSEVIRGLLACAEELAPETNQDALRAELERRLLASTKP